MVPAQVHEGGGGLTETGNKSVWIDRLICRAFLLSFFLGLPHKHHVKSMVAMVEMVETAVQHSCFWVWQRKQQEIATSFLGNSKKSEILCYVSNQLISLPCPVITKPLVAIVRDRPMSFSDARPMQIKEKRRRNRK
jgi:hypothetical protein